MEAAGCDGAADADGVLDGWQILSDEEIGDIRYDHQYDGAFTDAMMVVPVLSADGDLKGLIQVRNKVTLTPW